MSLKPICHPCRRFYRPEKNGFSFIEGMPTTNEAPPGMAAPALWKPYKLWVADLWQCPGCGHKLVAGFGGQPIAEQHEPDFADKVVRHKAEYQVNDC